MEVCKPEPIRFTTIRQRGSWPLRSSRSLLAATLTLLSGGFQLAVALSVNLDLPSCKHVLARPMGYVAAYDNANRRPLFAERLR